MGRARAGAAEVVPLPLLGDQLAALPAPIVVLVRLAAVQTHTVIVSVPVQRPPLPRLPGRVWGVPVVVIPAFVPPPLVWVVLLPAPGVFAFHVVVPAPVLVGPASAPGAVVAVPGQAAVLAGVVRAPAAVL